MNKFMTTLILGSVFLGAAAVGHFVYADASAKEKGSTFALQKYLEGWDSEYIGDVKVEGYENFNVYLLHGAEKDVQIKAFNDALKNKKKAGFISECRRLVTVRVPVGNGNQSYAGSCLLKEGDKEKSIEICRDNMAGRLTMEDTDPALGASIGGIINFMAANCYGG